MTRGLLILIVLFGLLAVMLLSGCQSTSYRTDARGQRYHVGDEWTAYKLDKNYNAHRVR